MTVGQNKSENGARENNGSRKFLSSVKKFLKEDQPWWIRDGVVALCVSAVVAAVVASATVTAQKDIDDERSEREKKAAEVLAKQSEEWNQKQATLAQRLQNQSFVRERSGHEFVERPFQSLDLQDLELAGLVLNGANLHSADLRSTNLRQTMLMGADLSASEVDSSTNFKWVAMNGVTMSGIKGELHLVHASAQAAWLKNVTFAGLSDTDISYAILYGADLRKADMKNVRLDFACHDAETMWPAGFTPPAPGHPNDCMQKYEDINMSTPKHNLWGLEEDPD